MDRKPPQDIKAEKSVLGSIMIDNNAYSDVSELIGPDDFYKPTHKEVFEAMEILAREKEPIDTVTLPRKLKSIGLNYIVDLVNETPTSANVMHYAKIVSDMSSLRKIIRGSTEAIEKAYELENPEEVTGIIEKTISDVSRKKTSDMMDARKVLFDYLKELEKRCNSKGIPGLPTGFYDVDMKLGGLQDGNFYLIGGRPSMGKTAFVTNIGEFVSMVKKKPVAMFSLEMTKEQLMNRTISSFGLIDSNKLKLGRIDDSDWQKIADIIPIIESAPLVIDDKPRQRVIDIASKSRRIKNKYGELGLIIIDYLQLISPASKGTSREQEVAEISRSLKILAKELNCPVMCLSQLSRSCESRDDKRPLLSDLRESGSIEQDADVVMFLYRDEYYHPDTEKKNIAEVIVAKGRNEGTGTIELAWIGQYTKFCNLEKVR